MNAHRRLNTRTLGKLVLLVALMFGFGYALVPFYRAFCNVVGINQVGERTALRAAENTQVDKSRTITVEFDANARGPLQFTPERGSMQLHPGQISQVMYKVTNPQQRTVRAQAIPSYAPTEAVEYFHKIECFCFTQQTFKANETREMPVLFVVDPKLPRDVNTITLSYTFFELGNTAAASRDDAKRGDNG